MEIDDAGIRLGNGDVISCDVEVDLTSDDSRSNVSRSGGGEEITWDLDESHINVLKQGLNRKYKKNFERCSKCEYFVMDLDADTGVSNFSCGLGVSRRDMLSGDICLLVN